MQSLSGLTNDSRGRFDPVINLPKIVQKNLTNKKNYFPLKNEFA